MFMNFEQILSAYKSKACVLSVETYPDGGYGNIRIAVGIKRTAMKWSR